MKLLQYVKDYPTLTLTVLSAYVYLCAYQYESSYLQSFNISDNYVTLDINTILKDGSKIIFFGFVIVGVEAFLRIVFDSSLKKRNRRSSVIKIAIRLAAMYLLVWMATPFSGLMFLYVLLGAVGVFVFFFIWAAIKILIEKRKGIPPPVTDKGLNNPSAETDISYYSLLYLFYPILICTFFGVGEASKKETFQIITDTTNYVVIRKYGDEVICKDLTQKNTLGDKTVVYKLSSTKPLITVERNLGQIAKK